MCGGRGEIDYRENQIAVSPPVLRCTILSCPSPRAKSAIRACINNRQRIPGRIGTPATVQTTTRGTSSRYSGASTWTRSFRSRRRNRTVGGCSTARRCGILILSSILHLAICAGSPRCPRGRSFPSGEYLAKKAVDHNQFTTIRSKSCEGSKKLHSRGCSLTIGKDRNLMRHHIELVALPQLCVRYQFIPLDPTGKIL